MLSECHESPAGDYAYLCMNFVIEGSLLFSTFIHLPFLPVPSLILQGTHMLIVRWSYYSVTKYFSKIQILEYESKDKGRGFVALK